MLTATILALIIMALLSVFQIALALGAPLGHFAWGGQHKILPNKLRIGSGIAIIIYAIFAVFAVSKAGIWEIVANETILTIGLWATTVYFAIGVVMNGISRSKPERYIMTPVTLLLAICFFVIATN